MRLIKWTAAFVFLSVAAAAQPAPQQVDPAFLQAALSALQAQRNLAMDNQAAAEARAAMLTDQLAKANARITELEKLAAVKPEPPK